MSSPPARRLRGRKNKAKILQQKRDQKRYKKKKLLNLDPSMPESMRNIVSVTKSKSSRKKRLINSPQKSQSQANSLLDRRRSKSISRRKRRILEKDSSSENED